MRNPLLFILCLLGMGSLRAQEIRDWPLHSTIVYDTCYQKLGEVNVDSFPDVAVKPLNLIQFYRELSSSDGFQLMREAGVITCRASIEILVGKDSNIVCYRLRSKCYPIYDVEIIQHIPDLTFAPAKKGTQPVNSWVHIPIHYIGCF
ncbi:MAG: hypothetical protein AAFV78_00905 [Bacteroidota bacterium]